MIMKKGPWLISTGTLTLFTLPFIAAAQVLPKTNVLLGSFGTLVNMALGITATIALLVFFWGIVKYISAAGDADKAKDGKSIMLYGAIALFVLFSIFGIIRWLRGEFGVLDNRDMGSPQVNPYVQP
ncbi:MAG: hypothetical protein AMXMBFR44_5930 [Candidatus Campbellbacteria bacterium]